MFSGVSRAQRSPIAIENWTPIDRTSTVCTVYEGRVKKLSRVRKGIPGVCNSFWWEISHWATNGVGRVKNLD